MSFSKRLAPLLIIFLLIYVATIFVAVLFVHNFLKSNVEQQYNAAVYFKLDSFAEEFNRQAQIYESKTAQIDLSDDESARDFFAVGQLDAQNLSLTLKANDVEKSYTVSAPVFSNLVANAINYYSFSEILISTDATDQNVTDTTRLLIFNAEKDGKTFLGFVAADRFAVMEEYGFASYGLLLDSTKIAVCDVSQNTGLRFGDVYGQYVLDGLTEIEFDGQKTYCFARSYTLSIDGTTAFTGFGLVDAQIPAQFSQSLLYREIIVLITIVVVSIVFVILCSCIVVREYKNIVAAADKDSFVVKTDFDFNIIKSNKAFKKAFPTAKFLSLVYVNPERKSGSMFCFEVKDENGNSRYLTMLLSRALHSFSFVGVDNTPVITEIGVGFKKIRVNADTFLPNEYVLMEDLKRIKYDFVIGIIKNLNMESFDTMFGHDFSDTLLKAVAKRMSALFSRIGGVYYLGAENCFVVVVDTPSYPDFVKEIPRLMGEINKPIEANGNLVRVESKGGFAICDNMMADHSFDNVFYYCEAALEKALENKEILYFAYHESQRKYYQNYLTKDVNIKKLIESNAIMVYYQPQYNIVTNRITGVEALMRTKPIENFNLTTMQIIRIAERTGNIIMLSDYIYEQGLKTAKDLEPYGISVSLNISPIQLMQAGFADDFLKKFDKYDLKSGSVCLEVTESYLMSNFDDTIKKLNILRDRGISIHLDDFGTAYSSLLYLKKLPISTIKIDKEFVGDMETNAYSRTIISNVTDICKSLKLNCIAEGVETSKQKDELFELGVDTIQGYFISKAVNKDALFALVDPQKEKKNDGI